MPDMSSKGRGTAMRPDNALSHGRDNELCIVIMQDRSEREVRWNQAHGCFLHIHHAEAAVCSFDEIEEWRPASVKF